jgi:hypothetical protein
MIHILGVLEANALMLALGYALLPALAFRSRPVVDRALLAYAVGVATTGVLAATLALVFVPLDVPVLVAVVACAYLVWWRARRRSLGNAVLPSLDAITALTLAPVVLLVARAAALYAIKPLVEFDGWVIWATRARALYEFAGPVAPIFTDPGYPALQHPLLLPALEATDAHFMGTWDGTAIHIQLLGLAIAFFGGGWALLRPYVWPPLLGATLAAIATAPAVLDQLGSNYADVPVAFFVALGVAALAAWLVVAETELLAGAAIFLSAAVLTKNEGELFAVCAFAAAAVACDRRRLPRLGLAAAAVAVVDAPWRIWIAAHHVKIAEYSVSNAIDPGYLSGHWDRVGPSARELLSQIVDYSWSLLFVLALAGVAGAFLLRSTRQGVFLSLWLGLAYGGLLVIYWISTNPLSENLYNSSNRTVGTLLVTGALVMPALLTTRRVESKDGLRAHT